MINELKIKQQVKKAIAVKPTNIALLRQEKSSNGMKGGTAKEVKIVELDVLIDDTEHSTLLATTEIKRTRNMTMLAVTDNIEINTEDYFLLNSCKYRIVYVQNIVKDVYSCDLEMVK